MGYLIREALKTLCGVNQWSYAVLWKIVHQNPRLLIWEECFCESPSFSNLSRIPGSQDPDFTFRDFHASWEFSKTCNFQPNVRAEDGVHLLINRMMTDNHVNIVGEGLVGRAAFTGDHQWILSENYFGEAHPPEVLQELSQQFAAGMKTVAVIPVIPHGVVQFGSYSTITENLDFVNAATALILQLDEMPAMSYPSRECTPRIGVPLFLGNSTSSDYSIESNMMNSSCFIPDGFYSAKSAIQTSHSFAREIRNNLQNTTGAFHAGKSSPFYFRSHDCYDQEVEIDPDVNADVRQLRNGVVKAEVIPTNSRTWSALDLPSHSSTSFNHGAVRCMQEPDRISRCTLRSPDGILKSAARVKASLISDSKEASAIVPADEAVNLFKVAPQNTTELSGISLVSDAKNGVRENITSMCLTSKMEPSPMDSVVLLTSNSIHGYLGEKLAPDEFYACANTIEQDIARAHDIPLSHHDEHSNMGSHIPGFYEDGKTNSGDDLFDILGADFKNKLFDRSLNMLHSGRDLKISSEVLPTSLGNSASGIFSTSADYLLDAVMSNARSTVKQSVDDSVVSCRTTLTNASSSSVPDVSVSCTRFEVSDKMNEQLSDLPKNLANPPATGSCSLRTGYSKEDRSQNSSMHGSELSSWFENSPNTKMNSSVSTGFSKKPDETNKTNRKRLKPGENPRPRPKDRQMIQDRVKELREIVPNGAKCSIDALLERTIKHMLFLQSVTKHADKLKQTGNSKIIGNNGSTLLKDNLEGGATWAYEVGSNSTVCPIIVEDLNQPRQMLVEMLCEERGLFLEIADIIRGLGLCILKGVMETRNDKIWARFAVEADRDVTRMEIFMALVRLLEQSSKGCVPQANDEPLLSQ